MASNPIRSSSRVILLVLGVAVVLGLLLWLVRPGSEVPLPEAQPPVVATFQLPEDTVPPATPATPDAKTCAAPKPETPDVAGPVTPSPKASGIIEGYVYGPDGTPAPKATVEAVPAQSTPEPSGPKAALFKATTDASGYFQLVDLPVSNYRVSAALDNAWAEEVALLGGDVDIAQVLLVLKSTGALTGFVFDERRRPVPNAHVTVISRDDRELSPSVQRSLTTTSAGDGAFRLDRMIAAEYLVRASAPGYAPALAEGCQVDVPVELRLARGVRLQGKLLRADTKRPLEGVRLVLQSSPATREDPFAVTARDGAFAFDDLSDGGYWLYAAEGPWQLVDGSVRIEIQGTRAPEAMTLMAGAAATVSGHVIDENTGAPMPGVTVSAHTPSRLVLDAFRRTRTDENGEFTFHDMPPGATTVRVDADFALGHGRRGYLNETLVLHAGDVVDDLVFAIQAGAPVSGIVRDANGKLAGGVDVIAEESWHDGLGRGAWSGRTRTDAHGVFHLSGAYGDSEIVLRATGATGMSEDLGPLHVGPDGLGGVELRLSVATGLLAGRVLSGDGVPVRAMLNYRLEQGNSGAHVLTPTDAHGYFVLVNAPPGNFEVIGLIHRPSGLYQGRGEVLHRGALAPGQHLRGLELTMTTPSPPITGVVYDFGTPAAGVVVTAEPADDVDIPAMELRVDTDVNGAFAFDDVTDTSYDIRAIAPDRSVRTHTARPGDHVELHLEPK